MGPQKGPLRQRVFKHFGKGSAQIQMKWNVFISSLFPAARAFSLYREVVPYSFSEIDWLDWNVVDNISSLNFEAGGKRWTFALEDALLETVGTDIIALRGQTLDNNKPSGWARFVVANDIGVRGSFMHDGEIFHVGGSRESQLNLSVFKVDSIPRLVPKSIEAGNNDSENYQYDTKRTNFTGDFEGCNHQLSANIGVVADCNFLRNFNTLPDVHLYITDIVNKASQLFEDAFNITLVLKEVVTPANGSTCPSEGDEEWNRLCNVTSDQLSDALTDRLKYLARFRAERAHDGFATWTLLTHCSGGEIAGLSWQGQVCEAGADLAGVNVVDHTELDFRVLAHETGHSFGAIHDCTSDTCNSASNIPCCPLSPKLCDANAKYIMNPESTGNQDSFSTCSRGRVCSAIEDGTINTTCLRKSKCPCPSGPCCNKCQYASKDVLCRKSASSCDDDSYCSGDSLLCPPNPPKNDGTVCGSGLRCSDGVCTSRDGQCVSLLNTTETKACAPADSCDLYCVSPINHTCDPYPHYFSDGISCKGGFCSHGRCTHERPLNWRIGVIAACIALGGLSFAALILFWCFYRKFSGTSLVSLSQPKLISHGEHSRYIGDKNFFYRPPPPPPALSG